MASNFENLEGFVDAIADRVLTKINDRPNQSPTGEPMLQLPDLPWGPKDVPPLLPHPKLHVQGLELTQSTQHYGTGYGPDNSVPIVALKSLVVRAYPFVTAGLLEGDRCQARPSPANSCCSTGARKCSGPVRLAPPARGSDR